MSAQARQRVVSGDDWFTKKIAVRAALRSEVTLGQCSTTHLRVIFFLTSFFNDSIHHLVATVVRLRISMKNGRENRSMAAKKKAKKGGKKKH
jgi:hypothetical protein